MFEAQTNEFNALWSEADRRMNAGEQPCRGSNLGYTPPGDSVQGPSMWLTSDELDRVHGLSMMLHSKQRAWDAGASERLRIKHAARRAKQ